MGCMYSAVCDSGYGFVREGFCDITWNLFQLLAGTSSINGTNKVIWVYMQLLNH